MDFAPTILQAADVPVPDWMEARSLADLLFKAEAPERDRVFAEHADDAILTGTQFMTMIREDRWKLVHFIDCEDGQLFDLVDDPGERVNLWADLEHQEVRRRLIEEILKWRIESARKTQGFVRMLAES